MPPNLVRVVISVGLLIVANVPIGCAPPTSPAPVPAATTPHEHAGNALVVKGAEFGDVRRALGIDQRHGGFQLSRPAKGAELVLEFYHEGKTIKTIRTGMNYPLDGTDSGKFCVDFIDMDRLALANGKKDHYRVRLEFEVHGARERQSGGVSTLSIESDVSKKIYGAGDFGMESGIFDERQSSDTELPLFYMIRKTTNVGFVTDKPKEIIQKNGKDFVTIAYIRLER